MASQQVRVRLQWLSPENRGRLSSPQGPQYFATIRMNSEPFAEEDWSVVLDNLRSSRGESEAVMSFVSDQAPFGALPVGVKFQLFEGRWPVAEGQVV